MAILRVSENWPETKTNFIPPNKLFVKSRIVFLSFALFFISSLSLISSCKKINEATELGDDLIPAIDNVTTFEKFLTVENSTERLPDSTQLLYSDAIALGHISNDQDFGTTHGDVYFRLNNPNPGTYPFKNKDSVIIDSVILSLAYTTTYGDTLIPQTVSVYEIDQNQPLPLKPFDDTVLYRFDQAPFNTLPTVLGTKTFTPNQLNDSVLHIRPLGDTTRMANVLRISLDTTLMGRRFVNYDTTANPTSGAFRTDSLFRSLFRGLKVEASNAGNALNYFNLGTSSGTKLTIYYSVMKDGKRDTTSFSLVHGTNGQANIIDRTESATLTASIGVINFNPLYIQTSPTEGTYGLLRIPQLDTMQNAVIHRAELIATRIPSSNPAHDAIFTEPDLLFLDRVNATNDSIFLFEKDMGLSVSTAITYNVPSFGGKIKNNVYRFNITRYVQDIVTRHEPNHRFRLYAPLGAIGYAKTYNNTRFPLAVSAYVAKGRVVLAGGTHADPNVRLRLRIVYSKI